MWKDQRCRGNCIFCGGLKPMDEERRIRSMVKEKRRCDGFKYGVCFLPKSLIGKYVEIVYSNVKDDINESNINITKR